MESVFKCKFHTKVDEKHIKEVLTSSKDLHSSKLAKDILSGKEIEIVGHLMRSE